MLYKHCRFTRSMKKMNKNMKIIRVEKDGTKKMRAGMKNIYII